MKACGLNCLSSTNCGPTSTRRGSSAHAPVGRPGDDLPQLRKSKPVYTPDIELLLDALQEPLSVVHTVDPRDAERNYVRWTPAIQKEVGVIEKAVQRPCPTACPCLRLGKSSAAFLRLLGPSRVQ